MIRRAIRSDAPQVFSVYQRTAAMPGGLARHPSEVTHGLVRNMLRATRKGAAVTFVATRPHVWPISAKPMLQTRIVVPSSPTTTGEQPSPNGTKSSSIIVQPSAPTIAAVADASNNGQGPLLHDSAIVGFITGERSTVRAYQHVLQNVAVAVHPAYHGQGWGTLLVENLLGNIAQWHPDIARVELSVLASNDRAVSLYRRHGFNREGIRFYQCFNRKVGRPDHVENYVWFNPEYSASSRRGGDNDGDCAGWYPSKQVYDAGHYYFYCPERPCPTTTTVNGNRKQTSLVVVDGHTKALCQTTVNGTSRKQASLVVINNNAKPSCPVMDDKKTQTWLWLRKNAYVWNPS